MDTAIVLAPLLATFGASQFKRLAVPWKYRPLYDANGAKWKVEADALHALALQETRENAALIGPANVDGSHDYGVMQINENNFARLGVTKDNWSDPAVNIEAAAHLLALQLQSAPDLSLLDQFSVYNAGWARDATTKKLRPRLTTGGLYVNEGYVISAGSWYALVWLGKLQLVLRLTH